MSNHSASVRERIVELVQRDLITVEDGVQLIHGLDRSVCHEPLDIAVIGMSGQFPGARNIDELWKNLVGGVCAIEALPRDRLGWKGLASTDSRHVPSTLTCRCGGFLSRIDQFDPYFFNLSRREAEMMDPRQRLFLQEAWRALEDAGYSETRLVEADCGVFVGCQEGDYTKAFAGELNPYIPTGNSNSILAARIAYHLNLRGPSLAIDTACSSSLVAAHLACESIRSGTCEMALAGGVLVMATPAMLIGLDKLGMFSPSGRCSPFDRNADGTVVGEAVGVVVLKPLQAALRDRDQIYGVIKGSHINQDGKTNGITAPSAPSQTVLEQRVYEKFRIDPGSIGYVEAHGTGTRLGDPIEIQALTDAFRRFTDRKQYCAIGSVKSNIGHSMPAAGIVGLIKTLCCLRHKKLVPSLNYREENEHIRFADTPFFVNTRLTDWQSSGDGQVRRRAAISAFGFSGTNCHMVLEEAPPACCIRENVARPCQIVELSAKSERDLNRRAADLERWLKDKGSDHSIEDVSFTLHGRKGNFRHRVALIASDIADLKRRLGEVLEGRRDVDGVFWGNGGDGTEVQPELREEGTRSVRELASGVCPSRDEYCRKSAIIAGLLAKGYDLDEGALFYSRDCRRISLPTYPFCEDQYWIPANEQIQYQTEARVERRDELHPLVHQNRSTLDSVRFSTRISGSEFYVVDHVVNGAKLVPGVVALEMARAAGSLAGSRVVCQIENHTWLLPVRSENGCVDLQIVLTPDVNGRGVDYTIKNGSAAQEHICAQGRLRYANQANTNEPATVSVTDIESIKTRCRDRLSGADCYQLLATSGYQYGATFQCIKQLWISDEEALAFLEAPEALKSGFDEYWLHPAIMDGAVQTVMGVLGSARDAQDPSASPHVPFTLGELSIHGRIPERAYVHVTRASRAATSGASRLKKYDILILGEDARTFVSMKALSLGAIKDDSAERISTLEPSRGPTEGGISTLYCRTVWEKTEKSRATARVPADVTLAFCAEEDSPSEVKSALHGHGRVVLVKPGSHFRRCGADSFELEPSSQDNYRQLISILREERSLPDTILHCWSREAFSDVGAVIRSQLEKGFYSMTYLVQALHAHACGRGTRLLYACPGVRSGNPLYAAVSATMASVGQENSRLLSKTVYIDCDPITATEGGTWWARHGACVAEEVHRDNGNELRWLDGDRYVKRLREFDPLSSKRAANGNVAPVSAKLKRNGVYLISGGLGQLGLAVAKHLIDTTEARLVLVGRSQWGKEVERRVRELGAREGEVAYVSADIAAPGQAELAVGEARQRYGRLDGIIHAAGISRDALVQHKMPEDLAAVLAPKVYGTIRLDEASKAEPLDFFVMFSSIAGILGNRGQSDYAFANRFMHEYVQSREELRRRKLRNGMTLSIEWPLWRAGGMRVDTETEWMVTHLYGMKPLPTVDGLEAFTRALCCGESHVTILHGESRRIRELLRIEPHVNAGERGKVCSESVSPADLEQRQLLEVVRDGLTKMAAALVTVNDTVIDPNADLHEYGLDSVALTAFSNEINRHYDLRVTPAVFFELDSPTIAALAAYLVEQFPAELARASAVLAQRQAFPAPERVSTTCADARANYERMQQSLVKMVGALVTTRDAVIDPETDIQEYGLDSVGLTGLANEINRAHDLGISPAVFFELDSPTIGSLARYLSEQFPKKLAVSGSEVRGGQEVTGHPGAGATAAVVVTAAKAPNHLVGEATVAERMASIGQSTAVSDALGKGHVEAALEWEPARRTSRSPRQGIGQEPIAIIGMSGVMPNSQDLDTFWEHLEAGHDLVSTAKMERWGQTASEYDVRDAKWGGFMKEVDKFDADFFNIPPREARMMDPQQRLFLQTVWKAIEDAGYKASTLSGSNTALFMGISNSDYYEMLLKNSISPDPYASICLSNSIRANRISYLLNLHGPSEPIDTACSSSLVAVHRGVEALLSGTCEMAIVGGVNAMISPSLFSAFNAAGMLSPDGKCRTFDKGANGYVRGEGVGALLLKPLSRAVSDGDHIYALIKGTAVNHGGRSKSLTSPNANAQAQVIIDAYERAGVECWSVSYIETHGTATALGDPVEINGLKKAFRELSRRCGSQVIRGKYCGIGSVKTNIGHLEAAAGIAGIIKVALAMKHEKLPAHLHFSELNPFIDLNDTPFYVNTTTRPWERLKDNAGQAMPRRAGVSSFGYGGTNAHVVLEEWTEDRAVERRRSVPGLDHELIVLSAQNKERLDEYVECFSRYLKGRQAAATSVDDTKVENERWCRSELKECAARILGTKAAELDDDVALSELGFDPVNLERLLGYINQAFERELTLELFKTCNSIDALTRHLCASRSELAVDAPRAETPSLQAIAYTLQAGRESMAERLAIVAASTEELLEKLDQYRQSGGNAADVQRGRVAGAHVSIWSDRARIAKGRQVSPAGTSNEELHRIAQMFVAGEDFDWQTLYVDKHPQRISLPTYPFARTRHWFDAAQPKAPPAGTVRPRKVALRSTTSVSCETQTQLSAIGSPTQNSSGGGDVRETIRALLADVLFMPIEKIDPARAFGELGLDSILGVEFAKKLKDTFHVEVRVTQLYDYSTVSVLADYLETLERPNQAARTSSANTAISTQACESPLDLPSPGSCQSMSRATGSAPKSQDIAIVGMAGRYPGAKDIAEYWTNIRDGIDSVRAVPAERWDTKQYFHPDPRQPGKSYSKWGGFLSDVDLFDTRFFNISPAEAELLDPQQRLFLQEAWRALEDAGYSAESMDKRRCGVYVGVMGSGSYYPHLLNGSSILAARISYFLNLKGPAISIDTACSSSLVAIHLACQSLLDGETDMMLAGGVTLYLSAAPYIGMCKSMMLSRDGKCKPFDNRADGFVPGEGVGVVVLKLLDRAIADGDQIYAVIKGSGTNQDGRTNSITAPSAKSQTALELEVYQRSDTHPADISYVEAHGTGTRLGDPIEIEALTEAFRQFTDKKQFCPIGSVKGNLGHTSAASGVAGLMKTVLALRNQQIPPSINYQEANRHIDFANSPFYVNTRIEHWKKLNGVPRRAAVSSFGYSGTNAHLVLEEAPELERRCSAVSLQTYLIPVSAKTREGVRRRLEDLSSWLNSIGQTVPMSDIAYTLSCGRSHFDWRWVEVAGNVHELQDKLRLALSEEEGICLATDREAQVATGALVELQPLVELPSAQHNEVMGRLKQAYLCGARLDWVGLFRGCEARRISLPLYPFVRERYWVPEELEPSLHEDTRRATEGTGNPLRGVDRSTADSKRYEIRLSGSEFFARDNVVYGKRILPGVAYLEMARAAGEDVLRIRTRKIKKVVWSGLIALDSGPQCIDVDLFPTHRAGEIDFEVSTRDTTGKRCVNSSGRLVDEACVVNEANAITRRVDIERVKRRCPSVLKGAECYRAYRQRKFAIGPSLQAIEELYCSEREALSVLTLPVEVEGNFHDFVLHPSLMDAVLQTVTGLMTSAAQDPGRPYLSFALGEVEILGKLPAKCCAYAQVSEHQVEGSPIKKFDVSLLGRDGSPVVVLTDFCLKKAMQEAAADISCHYQREPSASSSDSLTQKVEADVAAQVCALLKLESSEMDPGKPLLEYGFTSITMMDLINRINRRYHIEFAIDMFFDLPEPTITAVSTYLVNHFERGLVEYFGEVEHEATEPAGKLTRDDAESLNHASSSEPQCTSKNSPPEPIAIIGISGRFCRAVNLDSFWNRLKRGEQMLPEASVPGSTGQDSAGGAFYPHSGYVSDSGEPFEGDLFGMSPEEAEVASPLLRLALQTAWEVVQDAGYRRSTLAQAEVGLFLSAPQALSEPATDAVRGSQRLVARWMENMPSLLARRVAKCFGIDGPVEQIDGTHSNALLAVQRAVEQLRSGACRMAIAAGVNVIGRQALSTVLAEAGLLSTDGTSKAFDRDANGCVRGEGAAAILMKPLHLARADGDYVHAVLRAVSVDLRFGNNFYFDVHNGGAVEVIVDAYEQARIDPTTVSYIEAHAAGTPQADSAEIEALKAAFGRMCDRTGSAIPEGPSCAIGSLKNNVGHLEAAAGIAGIIKVVLAMRYKMLPPMVHIDNLNPKIELQGTPFHVPTTAMPWECPAHHTEAAIARRAGVSAFGYDGSSAHVIVEEWPELGAADASVSESVQEPQLIVLSANDQQGLRAYAEILVDFISKALASPRPAHDHEEKATLTQLLEHDLLPVASSVLKWEGERYDLSSVDELVAWLNQRFNLAVGSEVFLESPSIGGFIRRLARDWRSRLAEHYAQDDRDKGIGGSGLRLDDLAYTLQTGRDEMPERLGVVVSSLSGLRDKLVGYLQGQRDILAVFVGRANESAFHAMGLFEGEDGEALVRTIVERKNLAKLARCWVMGMHIDWTLLREHSARLPRRVPLPTYPCPGRVYQPTQARSVVSA